ncbi:hypothetical protein [Priestia koreensis]|uniref:Uncharacterized protein n=1 Tax=Priestia koreensis TaxID=284581 RepID=A0A0M0KNZ4_9BACI|nr:hypothetical protein [Priestia koreensis]KOO40337.1 hypothetical protein AMD01_21550 [Priestia koreensis]
MITIYLVDLFKLALVGIHLLADWHCTKRILELLMSYENIEFEGLLGAQQLNIKALAQTVIEEKKREKENEVAVNPVYSSIEGTEMIAFFNELYQEVNGSKEHPTIISDYPSFSDNDIPIIDGEVTYDAIFVEQNQSYYVNTSQDEMLTMNDYVEPRQPVSINKGLQSLSGQVIGMEQNFIHLRTSQSREWINIGENIRQISMHDYIVLEVVRHNQSDIEIKTINKMEQEVTLDYGIPDEMLA